MSTIYPWNTDWESLPEPIGFCALADPNVFRMFWDAAAERTQLFNVTRNVPTEPVAGDYAFHQRDNIKGWWRIIWACQHMGPHSLMTTDNGGSSPMSWTFAPPDASPDDDLTTWRPLPEWRRKYRRSIWRIDYPGEAGQRAIFKAWGKSFLPQFWYAASSGQYDGSPGPDYGQSVFTPNEQRWQGGLYFDHDGTGWVLSDDQLTPADLVDDFGEPKEGDIFGPWLLNDMKTILNACTTSVHTLGLGSHGTGWTNNGENNQISSSYGPGQSFGGAYKSRSSSGWEAAYGYPYVSILNSFGLTCSLTFYPGINANGAFNDFGDWGLSAPGHGNAGTITCIPSSTTSQGWMVPFKVGNLNDPGAGPDGGYRSQYISGNPWNKYCFFFCDWAVEGGFQYTAST